MSEQNVQSLLTKMLLDNSDQENETVQILDFVKHNSVPITNEQASALFLLQEMGMHDIANYVLNIRTSMSPFKHFTNMVDKMTLANRIKGNAKLDNVLKQDANPGLKLNTEKAARG